MTASRTQENHAQCEPVDREYTQGAYIIEHNSHIQRVPKQKIRVRIKSVSPANCFGPREHRTVAWDETPRGQPLCASATLERAACCSATRYCIRTSFAFACSLISDPQTCAISLQLLAWTWTWKGTSPTIPSIVLYCIVSFIPYWYPYPLIEKLDCTWILEYLIFWKVPQFTDRLAALSRADWHLNGIQDSHSRRPKLETEKESIAPPPTP